MNEITKSFVNQYVVTGEFDIVASVSPDKDSKDESKQVTLRFVMNSVPLTDIIGSSLKDKRINWQTGARAKFASIIDKQVVKVNYTGGRQPVDPKQAYRDYLASLTPEQREAELNELRSK